MSKVVVNGSLIPSVKNAPLDLRARINTIAEVESIQVPFVGMIFYVIDEEKFYVVKSLKGSKIGNIDLPDTTVDVFEPLIKVEVDNVEVDLSAYATIEKVEELIAAIEHTQYDDSEIKERIEVLEAIDHEEFLKEHQDISHLAVKEDVDLEIAELKVLVDEEKPYLADIAAYPTSKFLFACGQPMTVEPNVGHKYSAEHAEDAVAFVYRWAEGFECIMVEKAVAEKVYLVGGYGDKNVGARRSIPQTNMVARNVKIKGLIGGNYFEGMVGHVNIEAENCEFVSVIGGGWCGASVNGKATRMNVADDINIKMTNCKVSSTLYGGSQGNGVSDDLHMELNNCEIGWLTAGGANGMTRNAVVVMNGGSVKVAQSTNRGVVHKARFILNDGVVNKLYFGGETEDASVNGSIEDAFIELNGGIVKQFNFGTNNGVEMVADDVKGCIMNCVVESGDVSMLEVKVEEEVEINIDLSEYAKVEFVEEQIANIELKEGPAGKDGIDGKDGVNGKDGVDGKDFTYDMFTEEQLAALKGANGQDGAPGADGQPGKDGEQGPQGDQGVSVVKVEIVENHLMVTLSDDQVLDAGEMPAGQGGGTVNPEIEKELAETKQQLLDLTYGVEYEWIYFCEQDEELNSIGFNRETAPKFYEEIDEAINAGDEAFEEFIINMYEQDIYRMYVLRIVSEHKYANRYELLPLIDNPHHSRSAFLAKWNATSPVEAWNVDIENDVNGFEFIGGFPTSPLVLAFLKIKK